MRRDRASLSVAPFGVGTVYVSLPLGTYRSERAMLLQLPTERLRGVLSEPPQVLLLTGQGDLAARFRVEDFRGVLNLGYPAEQSDSAALVYNWVFSVPYAPPASRRNRQFSSGRHIASET